MGQKWTNPTVELNKPKCNIFFYILQWVKQWALANKSSPEFMSSLKPTKALSMRDPTMD